MEVVTQWEKRQKWWIKQCQLKVKMITQELEDTKTHNLFHQKEIILYLNTKKLEWHYLIQKDQFDSFNLVINLFTIENKVPGPGKYETIDKLSNSGKYIPSTSTGYGKRYFDKEKRVSDFEFKAKKNYNPGPGTYRTPSEFGQYDGDVYNHSMQMSKTAYSK